MGLFDIIKIKCPSCGKLNSFQSRAGKNQLLTYDADHVPTGIALSLEGKEDFCQFCHTRLAVKTSVPVYGEVWAEKLEMGED